MLVLFGGFVSGGKLQRERWTRDRSREVGVVGYGCDGCSEGNLGSLIPEPRAGMEAYRACLVPLLSVSAKPGRRQLRELWEYLSRGRQPVLVRTFQFAVKTPGLLGNFGFHPIDNPVILRRRWADAGTRVCPCLFRGMNGAATLRHWAVNCCAVT